MQRNEGIPFTQYLRPYGRKREMTYFTTKEVWDKAQEVIKAGFSFEIEELSTGKISATISDEDGDYHIMLFDNQPKVVEESIDALIMNCKIAEMRSLRIERSCG